jgi:hypothetical protein
LEEAAMSDDLAFIPSCTEFSNENSQDPNRTASQETGVRNEARDTLVLLPRTNRLDSTAEVESETRVHNAAVTGDLTVPVGSPIGTSVSFHSGSVFVQETSNRKSPNRPTRYKCKCGRSKLDFHVCKQTPGIGIKAYQAHLDSHKASEEASRQESGQSDSTSSISLNALGLRRSGRPSVPHGSAEGTTRGVYMCRKCRVPKIGCACNKQKGKKKEAEK